MESKRIWGGIMLLGLLLALVTSVVEAKGPPDKMTVSGPGLAGEQVFTDTKRLEKVGLGSLEALDGRMSTQPAGVSGEGFLVTRFFKNGNSTYTPFDRLRYYPSPATSGRDIIFYEGLTPFNGSSEYDGKWFYATEEGQTAMRALLTSVSALPSAGAGAMARAGSENEWIWMVGLLITIAGLAGVSLLCVRFKRWPGNY